jgi:hypothetical protein
VPRQSLDLLCDWWLPTAASSDVWMEVLAGEADFVSRGTTAVVVRSFIDMSLDGIASHPMRSRVHGCWCELAYGASFPSQLELESLSLAQAPSSWTHEFVMDRLISQRYCRAAVSRSRHFSRSGCQSALVQSRECVPELLSISPSA